MKNCIYVLLACTTLLCISCVEDVDFDQIDDVVLTPVFEFNFIFSEFDTADFVDPGLPPDTPINVPPITDVIDFDLIGTDFAVDNLERIDLTFEIRNTIATNFEFEFQFLDGSGQPIGTSYQIDVLPGNGEGTDPVVTNAVISLDNPTLALLANSEQMISEIRILNANTSLRGALEVRSIATYYVSYEL